MKGRQHDLRYVLPSFIVVSWCSWAENLGLRFLSLLGFTVKGLGKA